MHHQCVIKYMAFNITLIYKDYFLSVSPSLAKFYLAVCHRRKITRFMYMTFYMKGSKPTLEFTKKDIVTEASTF